MRLFAALRPDPRVVEHLVSALRPIRDTATASLRWPDPDQWHVTCAFYGEVPDGSLDAHATRVAAAARRVDALGLSLRGAGSFADRTLWIGVGGDLTALRMLMEACSDHETAQHRRAHLTVARARPRPDPRTGGRRASGRRLRDGGDLPSIVRALSVYTGPTWIAREVELVRSELGKGRSGGPRHTVVGSFPFGPTI
ncbi:RNA 2',3'-cyclic phosphodiesterase [Propionicicella superfundia]|uniref:RNA 2',3'-cyclic phosphodiesterase n=1 Tax=Propionicicella superfundia TaxID=348582 RepID=UPI00048F805A|nr:RNA 2',3'-cyclic phosphodiesterase [Propionicicella superfundia]